MFKFPEGDQKPLKREESNGVLFLCLVFSATTLLRRKKKSFYRRVGPKKRGASKTMGRRNFNPPSSDSSFWSLPSDRSSLNSYVSLDEREDKTGKPLMKAKTCWQRRCPCINCCCPCLPGWSQCLLLTLIILGSVLVPIFFAIGPITTDLINNSNSKIEMDGLAVNFPSLLSINISFKAKLVDPSPIAANVDNTTLRLSLQRNGVQEYIASVPLPAFHISPGANTTLNIPVLQAHLQTQGVVDALVEAVTTRGKITINSKADLVIHIPIWPFPIHVAMDKTMPPMEISLL